MGKKWVLSPDRLSKSRPEFEQSISNASPSTQDRYRREYSRYQDVQERNRASEKYSMVYKCEGKFQGQKQTFWYSVKQGTPQQTHDTRNEAMEGMKAYGFQPTKNIRLVTSINLISGHRVMNDSYPKGSRR